MKKIMLNFGSSSLQQFNNSELYGKRFSFKEYDSIICFEPLIEIIQFCKNAYKNQHNLEFVNKAVSNYSGQCTFKFQQNQLDGRAFSNMNIHKQIVGSAGTIEKDNMTPRYIPQRIQQRIVQVISIENVLIEYDINSDNYNVLKMDIEGSQYPVFQWLLTNNKMGLFKQIYVQFHSQLFNRNPRVINVQHKVRQFAKNNDIIISIQNIEHNI